MFDESTVDAVTEEVVEPQEVEEVIEGQEDESVTSEVADPKPIQSPDENAKYAAARRESERIAAEAQQRVAKLERDNTISRKYGTAYEVHSEDDIKAKFGDRGINTLEQFEQELQAEELRSAGLDPNLINNAVKNHPLFMQAEQWAEEMRQQKQEKFIKDSLDELHKEVPGTEHIKTVQDLDADPKSGEIASWIQRGYTIADAYYKVYKNDILSKSTKTAVQSTIANIQDKAKRGLVGAGDGGDNTTIEDLSDEGKKLANIFGIDPTSVAKHVKSHLKK
jgi:hypothetical protein